MASKNIHTKWGRKFGLSPYTVDYVYSFINDPSKKIEYLKYLARVTEWWDNDSAEYAPSHIFKNCKTPDARMKSSKEYEKLLMENPGIFMAMFFYGRKTGRDQGRVKNIGDFQSYLQRKYIKPKGRDYLFAYYLHHLIDYCKEVKDLFELNEIINRNKDRVSANDQEYDEIADFIRCNWDEIKRDLK